MESDNSDDSRRIDDDYIDQSLRRAYSDLTAPELPDHFKELLAKLHAQDAEVSKKNG